MKKILLAVAILAFYTSANAQLLSFGPRAGISSSTIKVDKPGTWDVDRESAFGYHVGLFARVQAPVIGLYVQPEVLFSKTGGKIRFNNDTDVKDVEYDFNRIDIPVLLGWRFGAFRLNAGPTFNFITKDDSKERINQDDFDDIEDDFKKSTVGYQAGLGFDLGKLLLDLKYEGSLSKFGDNVELFGEDFPTDQRNTQLILSLGYKF